LVGHKILSSHGNLQCTKRMRIAILWLKLNKAWWTWNCSASPPFWDATSEEFYQMPPTAQNSSNTSSWANPEIKSVTVTPLCKFPQREWKRWWSRYFSTSICLPFMDRGYKIVRTTQTLTVSLEWQLGNTQW
jgi:hypothetical protein